MSFLKKIYKANGQLQSTPKAGEKMYDQEYNILRYRIHIIYLINTQKVQIIWNLEFDSKLLLSIKLT